MPSATEFYENSANTGGGTTSSSSGQILPMMLNGAVVATLLGASVVGTGGVASPQTLTTPMPTGSLRAVAVRHEQDSYLSTQEKISGIRHYLSLNMTDLAAVLNVGRPTVYQWTAVPNTLLKANHRERLNAIYKAARYWRTLSAMPMGPLIREPAGDNRSMLDLLSSDRLNLQLIHSRMRQLKEMQDRFQKRLTVAQVANRAGVKLASRPQKNWRAGLES